MSARFRRTNKMIEIDAKRVECQASPVPWAALTNAAAIERALTNDPLADWTLIEPDPVAAVAGAQPVGPSISEPIATARIEPTVSVEYTPVETGDPTLDVGPALTQAAVIDLSTKTAQQIVATAVEQFEQRLQQIAATVRPKQVIAGIKVNDQPVAAFPEGAHPALPEILRLTLALRSVSQHVLAVGPAGCGKTLIGRQLAAALKVPLTIIPMSQGVSEAHLHGRFTPTGWQPGVFADAFSKPGVIVLDELDAGDRNAVLSLNAPLAGEGYTNPLNGQWVDRHKECWIIATANTVCRGTDGVYSAREQLDAATPDRFLFEAVTYLESVENTLCQCEKLKADLRTLRTVIEESGAREFVGYRAFQRAQVLKDAGYTRDQILTKLIFPWAPDLKDAAIRKLSIVVGGR